jgi:hypothetical protein
MLIFYITNISDRHNNNTIDFFIKKHIEFKKKINETNNNHSINPYHQPVMRQIYKTKMQLLTYQYAFQRKIQFFKEKNK